MQNRQSEAIRRVLIILVFGCLVAGSATLAGDENEALAALSVVTEPPGATVYVDGKVRGQSPLNVEGLPAGGHRVKLVKDGYLENSRVLNLRADRTEAVTVTLTPSGDRPNAVEAQIGTGGGGGSIWTNPLFLGAVAAGGVTAAYFAFRDTNDPPIAGSVSVSPADVGIASLTTFTFTAVGASDPDGDALTFMWTFGDGGSGSGETVTHDYGNAGTFAVTLTVSDGKESATAAPGSVTVTNMNGTWVSLLGTTTRTWVLTQTGTSISGTYMNSAFVGVPGTVSGSLVSPRDINVTAALSGITPFTFVGTINSGVTQFSGVANGSGFVNTSMTFNKQ